jgi:hypothetical protein
MTLPIRSFHHYLAASSLVAESLHTQKILQSAVVFHKLESHPGIARHRSAERGNETIHP